MYNAIFFTDETNNIASIPPIGAYKCANVLRKNGYTCLVVNHLSAFTTEELKKLIDLAITDQTKLIAFSTTFLRSVQITKIPGEPTPEYPDLPANTIFPQGKEVEDLFVEYVKIRNPKIKFAAGGTKVNSNYANKNIDYVCLGYSETSILNLMNHLCHNTKLTHAIKNVWGVTVIDDRYAKDYDFVNDVMTWLPEDVVNHRTLPLEVARGCIFKCKFCSYPLNGKQNLDFVKCDNSLRYELEKNYAEHGISQYLLVDDTFNDHEDKLLRLQSIVDSLPFRPTFWGYHRLDLIATRPHTVQTLHNIGIRAMYFGIESMNPATAKIIGKGYNRDKQIETVQRLRSDYPDVSLHGSFIVGLPEETPAQIHETAEQLLSQSIPLHSWQFHPLYIVKPQYAFNRSDIDENFEQYGYTDIGSDTKFVNWRNQYFDFASAQQTASSIMSKSYRSDHYHVPGLLAITVAGMQHPGLDFNTVKSTCWAKFDFNNVEDTARIHFLQEYKQKLFNIVAKKQQI
jgi:radical SAM superfamily enzyme YgiQ (UPF0313 family)